VGVASTLVARSFGITSTVGKAATFAIAFVLVFGGYSYWMRRSAPTSSPS
jgi:hypothetical protein